MKLFYDHLLHYWKMRSEKRKHSVKYTAISLEHCEIQSRICVSWTVVLSKQKYIKFIEKWLNIVIYLYIHKPLNNTARYNTVLDIIYIINSTWRTNHNMQLKIYLYLSDIIQKGG